MASPQAPASDKLSAKGWPQMFVEECPEGVQANIRGKIPAWMNGSLLRTGPGRYEFGENTFKHLFDGQALLHRFNFENGSVSYQSRYLDSESYKQCMNENRIVYAEFGTAGFPDPCMNIFSRTLSTFLNRLKFTDNCNVNWMRSGDECYAITETPKIQKVNPKTLEKEETIDMSKIISVFTGTAHPHQDKDGTIYNLGLNFKARSTYNIIQIPPAKPGSGEGPILNQATIALSIPCTHNYPTYSHSFFMTPNYFVLVEQPLFINMIKLASLAVMGYSFCELLEFSPDLPTRFHVVRRSDNTPVATKYVSEAQFFFHQINAYEQDGHIVLDMCSFKDDEVIRKLYIQHIRENGLCNTGVLCKRFILPLNIEGFKPGDNVSTLKNNESSAILESADTVYCKPIIIGDVGLELPRINYEKHNGRYYRYAYGIIGSEEQDNLIAKIDIETGTSKRWSEDGCLPSEPVFIGAPEGQEEDDGVVISSVINFNDGGSPFLIVLDGKTFTELGRAEIPLPTMSYGIHGLFVPSV